jgi:serine/threonine protein kinase
MSNKIGRFEILSEISKSPIGFVYKANDPENSTTVALKTLTLEAMGEHVGEMVQRLVQESQGTGSLSSHNIAQLLGVDEIEGKFVAALEYVQGNSIATMLARNEGFSIWDIKDIARQSAQALDHAHSRKVFHFSLEPDKIMSGWDGTVKVLGFGISAMSIPSVQLHKQVPRIMHYMSPEQWLGQPVDARSNLFSMAAILYEMMTEQKAFDGETEDEIKQMILEGTPVPPHQINNKIASDVSSVIMKALSKAPAERFASGQELVTAMEGHKEPTTVASPAKKATVQHPAKGINIPGKAAAAKAAAPAATSPQAAPAQPTPAEPEAQPAATAKSVVIQTHPKQAAAAAAGWGGVGTGSPTTEARAPKKSQPSSDLVDNAYIQGASSEQAVMSAAVEDAPAETKGFKVDPAMDDSKPASPARKSFSELNELPPLKEVHVAPPPPPPAQEAAEQATLPTAPIFKPKEEKPKIQPKVVAKKAVQEIKKTPPQLFGYSIAGAVGLILLVVAGIWYHIHSQNGDEGAPPPIVVKQPAAQPASTPAPAPVVAAEPTETEPDVITIQPKPVPRKAKPAAPVIVPGEITVSSNPDGAQIQLDGQSNPGWVTPVILSELQPGKHTITVSKAGYSPETRTLEIASRSKSVLSLQLALMPAALSVTSSPGGAKVYVDGKDMGKATPLQFTVDKPGNHTILVRKDGYLDESSTMNLQAGQSYHFSPTLRQLGATAEIKYKKFMGGAPEGTGTVIVKTQPKGAQVTINRRILDKTAPVEFYLNPGTYVLEITASGYKKVERVINVEKGAKTSIDETLQSE